MKGLQLDQPPRNSKYVGETTEKEVNGHKINEGQSASANNNHSAYSQELGQEKITIERREEQIQAMSVQTRKEKGIGS